MQVGTKRQVKVRLRTLQVDPAGDTWQMTHEYDGTMYDRPSERYIIFEEPDPRVTTTYKIREDEVLLTRRGAITCTQVFRQGDWHYYEYMIAEGSLDLRALTQHMDADFGDLAGALHLKYELWSGEVHLGNYTLELTVEAAAGEPSEDAAV
jgi:uncharacterized beta-barrel protein YwiB (DUF1934 family)